MSEKTGVFVRMMN